MKNKLLRRIFKLRFEDQKKIIGLILFEIKSWIGRSFFKHRSRIIVNKEPALLDLGAGENFREGWIHANFFRYNLSLSAIKSSKKKKAEIELDLRYPINCKDNIIDGIYCGHTLEHFYPIEVQFLLIEIYRILKPFCWLRINVPDTKKYVDYYSGKKVAKEFSSFNSGCDALMNISQNWGHHSLWDKNSLSATLASVGFINISEVEFGLEGTDKRLIKEEEVRRWETLVVEAQK